MEVCTAGALAVPVGRFNRVPALLRAVGVVVGVLFGLGLIAMFVADRAAADERSGPADVAAQANDVPVVGGLGRLTEPVTGTAGSVVSQVVEPVADVVTRPVVPVARAAADVVTPVVRPVVDAVVVPLVPVVEPVLAAAAPVAEPLLAPVLDAAKPVVTPVTDATGLTDVADEVVGAVSGARSPDVSAPVDRSLPTLSPESSTVSTHMPVAALSVSRTVREASPGTAAPAAVEPGQRVAPGSPGPRPGLPTAPVPFVATGGGVAGGTGGQHGGDAAVVRGSDGVVGHAATSGRGPPGTVVGVAWFGYDDRDHPS